MEKKHIVPVVLVVTALLAVFMTFNYVLTARANDENVLALHREQFEKVETCNQKLDDAITKAKRLLDAPTSGALSSQMRTALTKQIWRSQAGHVDLPADPDTAAQAAEQLQTLVCEDSANLELHTLEQLYQDAITYLAQNLVSAEDDALSGNQRSAKNGQAFSDAELQYYEQMLQQQRRATDQLAQELTGQIDALRQRCEEYAWQNSQGIVFSGCDDPQSADYEQNDYKLWEDALRDGDICINEGVASECK
jgi:hypothetical protein